MEVSCADTAIGQQVHLLRNVERETEREHLLELKVS